MLKIEAYISPKGWYLPQAAQCHNAENNTFADVVAICSKYCTSYFLLLHKKFPFQRQNIPDD